MSVKLIHADDAMIRECAEQMVMPFETARDEYVPLLISSGYFTVMDTCDDCGCQILAISIPGRGLVDDDDDS